MAANPAVDTAIEVVYKAEKALYSLITVTKQEAYKTLVGQLPEAFKNLIQVTLKEAITGVKGVIDKILNNQYVAQAMDLMNAVLEVTQTTMDLLSDAARTAAEKAERFMRAVIGVVTAGAEHMKAIINLIDGVVTGLTGGSVTLEAATVTTLKTNPLLPAASVTA